MLTAKAQYSLNNAEKYFEEHLSAGDYYGEGKQVRGQWFGLGARQLGFRGAVGIDNFVKLCRNTDPNTNERLTQRRKAQNRRVFYDFTLSPPKSVSIVALVAGDRRVEESHHRAVGIAVVELERFAAARVRKNGASSFRPTGNIVGAMFHHDTSRALDPHLHSHCIIFNATRDPVEDRWKALETYDMLAACKYAENVYYHELAQDLRRFGYELENTRRGDFEVKGVPRALIERFSKRHNEIDRQTEELLNASPEKRDGNVKAVRENLAHKNRARKIKDIGRRRLTALWDGQIFVEEKAALSTVRQGRQVNRRKLPKTQIVANAAITWAEQHLFDRRSVVNEFEIWRHALEHGRGQNFSLKHVQAATKRRPYIRNEAHPGKVTMRRTLEREQAIVARAGDGRDRFAPFNAGHRIRNGSLDSEQTQHNHGIHGIHGKGKACLGLLGGWFLDSYDEALVFDAGIMAKVDE